MLKKYRLFYSAIANSSLFRFFFLFIYSINQHVYFNFSHFYSILFFILQNRKFVLNGELTVESLKEWMTKFHENRLGSTRLEKKKTETVSEPTDIKKEL